MIDKQKLREHLDRSIALADTLKSRPLDKSLRDYWLSLAADEFRPVVAVIRAAQFGSLNEREKGSIEEYARDLNIEPRSELIDFLLRKSGTLADHLRRGRQNLQL